MKTNLSMLSWVTQALRNSLTFKLQKSFNNNAGANAFRDQELERNRHVLEQHRKPFQLLYEQIDRVENDLGLVSLRVHLVRTIGLFAKLEGLSSARFSTACYTNLYMAASLHGLDVDTDISDDGMWCGNVSNYEGIRTEIVSTFVAGRIAFEMAFHAYEVLGQEFCKKSRSVTTQQISRKLMSDETHRPLHGFAEIATAAISSLPFEFDTETQDAQRAIVMSSNIGLGAECLRQFRNALVHGRLKAPEPIEWHDGSDPTSCQQARIFRAQIRLCLLLIQTIVERMVGDEIVEDSDFQEFSVRDVVANLHVSDFIDDDEDDPDQPAFAGLKTAPRFHYW